MDSDDVVGLVLKLAIGVFVVPVEEAESDLVTEARGAVADTERGCGVVWKSEAVCITDESRCMPGSLGISRFLGPAPALVDGLFV